MSQGPTLFFEVSSPLQVLLCWRRVRRAGRVVFGRRTPFDPVPVRDRRWAHGLARSINRSAAISELTVGDLIAYLHWNKRAVELMSARADAIVRTNTYQRVRRIIPDDILLRYYQAALVRHAATWQLFPDVAATLARDGTVDPVAQWDTAQLSASPAVPLRVGVASRLQQTASRWGARLSSLAMPAAVVFRALRHGLTRARRGPFALGMPVWWGLADEQAASGLLRRPNADDYLYGERLKPGDILHLFGEVPHAPADEQRYRAAFKERGYAFADLRTLPLDRGTLRAAWQTFAGALRLLLPHRGGALDDALLRETPKALFHYLRKHLIHGNLHYRAELVRNDYNPGHVIAAIVSRDHGVRTVAVQHNALPYEAPQLAFLEADDLAIFGSFYQKGYAPNWERLRVHCVGRESLDWTVGVRGEGERVEGVRRRWAALRPATRKLVLLLLPSERDITIPAKWREMHRGLQALAAEMPAIDVVMKFRTERSLAAPHIAPLAAMEGVSDHFLRAPDGFSTYELMAIADLVITYDGSFSVNEALALDVPVFSFEFIGAGGLYFDGYGKDFVLKHAADVVRTLKALAAGALGTLDVDWHRLKRDLNCYADGRNQERMRALLEGASQ